MDGFCFEFKWEIRGDLGLGTCVKSPLVDGGIGSQGLVEVRVCWAGHLRFKKKERIAFSLPQFGN